MLYRIRCRASRAPWVPLPRDAPDGDYFAAETAAGELPSHGRQLLRATAAPAQSPLLPHKSSFVSRSDSPAWDGRVSLPDDRRGAGGRSRVRSCVRAFPAPPDVRLGAVSTRRRVPEERYKFEVESVTSPVSQVALERGHFSRSMRSGERRSHGSIAPHCHTIDEWQARRELNRAGPLGAKVPLCAVCQVFLLTHLGGIALLTTVLICADGLGCR
jgi:hypothetical protein